MLTRKQKETFYLMFSPFMRLNSFRLKFAFHLKKNLKVHLGPGRRTYLDGWINVDANIFTGKSDIWCDFRYKLPFNDNSVQYLYSHHVVEHLPDLRKHFTDIYRILQPGGIYRFGGPNGDSAIKKFIENDLDWFGVFPEKYNSIGGRFYNFIFCKGEHLQILTFSHLKEILDSIGYKNISVQMPTKSTSNKVFNECLDKEFEDDFIFPHTLIIECIK